MLCSSRSVPSVATTSACVSPRVNSAEPWVRGSTPSAIAIGRTVRVSRPSMRGSPSRIWLRTMLGLACRTAVASTSSRVGLGWPSAASAARRSQTSAVDFVERLRARLLAADLVGRAQPGLRPVADQARCSASSLAGGLPVPLRLAGIAHQLVDRVDRDLHLLMAEHHRAQHHVLGQLLGLGLDHQHRALGAGDHQVRAG